MTRILAVETATPHVGVAVGVDGAVRGALTLGPGRRHAEQLVPAIRYLTTETGVALEQLAAVAVGVGPGLFTGLRVGITTATVLAQALRVPVVDVGSLDLVAYPLRHTGRMIAVALDARRREVFHARYRPVPGGVQRVSDYAVAAPGELAAELAALGADVLLAGDGFEAHPGAFAGLDRAVIAGPGHGVPSVAALVELATARVHREEFTSPFAVRPLYLRESDAVIDWQAMRR